MLTIFYGSEVLYDQRDASACAATDVTLTEAMNAPGELAFTLHRGHPLLGRVNLMDKRREVTVLEDGESIFRGRVTGIKQDFQGSEVCTCEGDLAYLDDALLPPFDTSAGTAPATVDGFFTWMVSVYNATATAPMRFQVGTNEGHMLDKNNHIYRKSEDGSKTVWEVLADLLGNLGGMVSTRIGEDGVRYIDLKADTGRVNAQRIEFGVNLLDFTRTREGLDLFTRIIPVGAAPDAEEDGTQADAPTLDTLPDGKLEEGYAKSGRGIDALEAQKVHGVIERFVKFDDCTTPKGLCTSALSALKASLIGDSMEFTAFDLSRVDYSAKRIKVGEYIRATSKPHNFDEYFLCTKREYKPSDPGNERFSLGSVYSGLSAQMTAKLAGLTAGIDTVSETVASIGDAAKSAADSAREAMEAAKTSGAVLSIESAAGTIFRDGEVSTVLRASVQRGGSTITDSAGLLEAYPEGARIEWQEQLADGSYNSIDPSDSRVKDGGFTFTYSAHDVEGSCIIRCNLIA